MIGSCSLLTRISKREIKVSADVNKRTALLGAVKTVDNVRISFVWFLLFYPPVVIPLFII